jgi:hypothetical protein
LAIADLPCEPLDQLRWPGTFFFWAFGQEAAQVFAGTRQKSLPIPPGESARIVEQDRFVPLPVEKKGESDKMSGDLACVHFYLLD